MTDADPNKKIFRLQMAVAVAYETFWEDQGEIDGSTCDLLTSLALDYCKQSESGDRAQADLALESTLGYVLCDQPLDVYDEWKECLEDCIATAEDGGYDDIIDFENGLFPGLSDEELSE
jgi:hypothetical protein